MEDLPLRPSTSRCRSIVIRFCESIHFTAQAIGRGLISLRSHGFLGRFGFFDNAGRVLPVGAGNASFRTATKPDLSRR